MVWGQTVPAGVAIDWGRVAYLLVAFATHALVGAVLASVVVGVRPSVGAVAGLAADVDFLFPQDLGFPFVHRGLTHSPAALVAVLLVGYGLDADDDRLAAVGVAYLSHLVVDTLTPKGVLWFYPLSTAGVGFDLDGHSPAVTLAVWMACGAVYAHHRGLPVSVTVPRRLGLGRPAEDEGDPDGQ